MYVILCYLMLSHVMLCNVCHACIMRQVSADALLGRWSRVCCWSGAPSGDSMTIGMDTPFPNAPCMGKCR